MKYLQNLGLAVVFSFLCIGVALAQSDLEKLVEQTGIEAGDVAMRDLPNWRG